MRPALVAAAGVVVAAVGAAWYGLARSDSAGEVGVDGVSLALVAIGLGGVLLVISLTAAVVRRRRRTGALAVKPVAVEAWPGSWPTIVVRDHHRARPPQTRSVPSSSGV